MPKAPHEMMAAEYRQHILDLEGQTSEWYEMINWDSGPGRVRFGDHLEAYRREAVIPRAQAEGKVIPEEVLRELGL